MWYTDRKKANLNLKISFCGCNTTVNTSIIISNITWDHLPKSDHLIIIATTVKCKTVTVCFASIVFSFILSRFLNLSNLFKSLEFTTLGYFLINYSDFYSKYFLLGVPDYLYCYEISSLDYPEKKTDITLFTCRPTYHRNETSDFNSLRIIHLRAILRLQRKHFLLPF